MGLQIPRGLHSQVPHQLRPHLGEVFRKLAAQKGSRIEEGHLMADHVHMMISIPPKYAVSRVVGFIKGKSAIHLARVYGAHSDDRDHSFRRIATTCSNRSRPV